MGSRAALVYIFFGAVGADDNSLDYQQNKKPKMNVCAHGLTSPTHILNHTHGTSTRTCKSHYSTCSSRTGVVAVCWTPV